MEQFKVSTKFTEAKKLMVFLFALSFLISFQASLAAQTTVSAGNAQQATETLSTSGQSIVINTGDTDKETPEEKKAKSCKVIEDDLNSRIRKLNEACSVNKKGNCIETAFKCSAGNNDSDECTELNEVMSSDSKDDQKEQIEALEEKLEKLEEKTEKYNDELKESKSKVEELNNNYEDFQSAKLDAENEYKEELKLNDENKNSEIASLQSQIEDVDNMLDSAFLTDLGHKKAMNDFLTEARILCRAEATKIASVYYNKLEQKFVRNKEGLSMNSYFANYGKSMTDIANEKRDYETRKCMRVSGDSDVAIKYKQLQTNIRLDLTKVKFAQAQQMKRRNSLFTAIQTANQKGIIANGELALKQAQKAQLAAQQEGRLRLQIAVEVGQQNIINKKISEESAKINELQTEISTAKKNANKALKDSDLTNLKGAYADIPSMISEAKSQASTNECGCKGAFKTVANYTGENFCETPSEQTADEDVEATE